MAEQPIWQGHPSQLMAFKFYFGALLLAILLIAASVYLSASGDSYIYPLLALPVIAVVVLINYFLVRTTRYVLTSERLVIEEGVLNRRSEEIELYRVRDWSVEKPFWLRVVNRGHVKLFTSDESARNEQQISGIVNPDRLRELLRKNVEIARDKKRVRQVDFASGDADGEHDGVEGDVGVGFD